MFDYEYMDSKRTEAAGKRSAKGVHGDKFTFALQRLLRSFQHMGMGFQTCLAEDFCCTREDNICPSAKIANPSCESRSQACLPAESRPARSFQSYLTVLLGPGSRKHHSSKCGFTDRSMAYRSSTVSKRCVAVIFSFILANLHHYRPLLRRPGIRLVV